MILRPDSLAASTRTVSATETWPPPSSLIRFLPFTSPALRNQSRSTTVPAAAPSRRATATGWYSTRVWLVKPRLGRRRWIGIWPPSNHAGILPPARAFLPLCPLPAVPPRPVPAPLPRRLLGRVAPAAG